MNTIDLWKLEKIKLRWTFVKQKLKSGSFPTCPFPDVDRSFGILLSTSSGLEKPVFIKLPFTLAKAEDCLFAWWSHSAWNFELQKDARRVFSFLQMWQAPALLCFTVEHSLERVHTGGKKRAGMKVALPTLTCQARVTFPPRFIRYFRWKPCQAGTFPPDKTLYRKYRIERSGQKLRTASRSVFLSFLTLSRGKIGDGKKYSSGSRSLEQFFFPDRCRVLSAALRRVPSTAALAVSKRRADSCQEINGHFFSRQRERERSRVTEAVISAFVSSSFAKLRRAALQRRKNTVLGRQLPLDVALRFAAPLVSLAWPHASVYVEGKLSAFWCRPSLSHDRETCFRDPRKQLTWAEDLATRRLRQVWPLCTRCAAAWCECSSIFSRSHAIKWRHIAIHAKEAFTAGVNAPLVRRLPALIKKYISEIGSS